VAVQKKSWDDGIRRKDIIRQIIAEYGLTQEELDGLFQTDTV